MGYDIAKTAGHRNLRERCDAVLKQGAGTASGANGKNLKYKTPRGRTMPSPKKIFPPMEYFAFLLSRYI
jgi:hypothetical protein